MILLQNHPLLHRYLRERYAYLTNAALDIHVPFSDETELIGVIYANTEAFFLGGLGIEPHRPVSPGEYRGLSDRECEAISQYRAFKLFQPWPTPQLTIQMNSGTTGYVAEVNQQHIPIHMHEIGSAQVWWSPHAAVIWEVLLSSRVVADPQQYRTIYVSIWSQIESYLRGLGVRAFVTEHDDPGFDRDWYQDVLRSMGYMQIDGGAFRKEITMVS